MDEQPWTILRPHRIRWSECDPYGHVNHTAYLTLFEDLRVAHWEGLVGGLVGAGGPGPVVARIEVRYLRPAHFGDHVMLACRTVSFRHSSFVHDYAMTRDGIACCTARMVCVVTRQDDGRKVPLLPEWTDRLRAEGAIEG